MLRASTRLATLGLALLAGTFAFAGGSLGAPTAAIADPGEASKTQVLGSATEYGLAPCTSTSQAPKPVTVLDESWWFSQVGIGAEGGLSLAGFGQVQAIKFFNSAIAPTAVKTTPTVFSGSGRAPVLWLEYGSRNAPSASSLHPVFSAHGPTWASYQRRSGPGLTYDAKVGYTTGSLKAFEDAGVEIRGVGVVLPHDSTDSSWTAATLQIECTDYSFARTTLANPALDQLKVSDGSASDPIPSAGGTRLGVQWRLNSGNRSLHFRNKNTMYFSASGTWQVTAELVNPDAASWETGGNEGRDVGSVTVHASSAGKLGLSVKPDSITSIVTPSGAGGSVTLKVTNPTGHYLQKVELKAAMGANTKTLTDDLPLGESEFEIKWLPAGRYSAYVDDPAYPELRSDTISVFIPPPGYTTFAFQPTTVLADTGLGYLRPGATDAPAGHNGTALIEISNSGELTMPFDVAVDGEKVTTTKDLAPGTSEVVPLTGLAPGQYAVAITPTGTTDTKTATISIDDARQLPGKPRTVAAGGSLAVAGTTDKVLAGAPVGAWLLSTPVKVGSAHVAADGSWRVTASVPPRTSTGSHRLLVVDSASRVVQATPLSITAASATGQGSDGSTTPDRPRPTGGLANSGFDGAHMAVLALALTGTGAITLGAARMRRESARRT